MVDVDGLLVNYPVIGPGSLGENPVSLFREKLDAVRADPNVVAEYLSDNLESEQVTRLEETCLKSDVHLAEVAAVHQILTVVMTEPVRVPPRASR